MASTVIVAHRAGNHPETARRALDRADMIELDVHVFRGRVEVRHEKVLRPTRRLWERWYLLPRGERAPELGEILTVVGPKAHLLLDLKCFTRGAARRIRDSLGPNQPVMISSRSWWVLGAFDNRPGTPAFRSCGNGFQLWLARTLPSRSGVTVHERLLTERAIKATKAKTAQIYSWGLQTVERGEDLVAAGIDGLIVDDLELAWPR